MGHLNIQKIGQDTDEEAEEEIKPRQSKNTKQTKESTSEAQVVKQNYVSILAGLDEPEYRRYEAKQYLFENIDLVQDSSKGQRGFNRNIDRLGNQLIHYYKQLYPRDYDKTLSDIEYREQQKIEDAKKLEQEELKKIQLARVKSQMQQNQQPVNKE